MDSSAISADFRKAHTATSLARFCGASPDLLEMAIAQDARNLFYKRHLIPRKRPRNGSKYRVAWQIRKGPLLDAFKSLARRLEHFAREHAPRYPHNAACGYIKGRSTYENAKPHCGSRHLLNVDIRDFFSSITTAHVQRALTSIGVPAGGANAIATLCTLDGSLPLGFHTSPLLANLTCLDFDDRLEALANAHSCTYTRYADDLAFSGNTSLPPLAAVRKVLEREGFSIAQEKVRQSTIGQQHFVTGLSICDSSAPHAPRPLKKRLRQELYYCNKYGLESHIAHTNNSSQQAAVNRLDGMVNYIASIEKHTRPTLKAKWAAILRKSSLRPIYHPQDSSPFRHIHAFIDESTFVRSTGDRYYAVALVETEDRQAIRESLEALAEDYLTDPISSGRSKAVVNKTFHFTEAPEELRDRICRYLETAPCRAYIAFDRLSNYPSNKAAYLALFQRLLIRRFLAADRGALDIRIERNPELNQEDVGSLVRSAYLELERADQKRPLQKPSAELLSKQEAPELALPDCFLGVLGRYLRAGLPPRGFEQVRFERLRYKYRVVLDLEQHTEFNGSRLISPWP